MSRAGWDQTAFLAFLTVVFGGALYRALDFPRLARMFPVAVCVIALGLVVLEACRLVLESRKLHDDEGAQPGANEAILMSTALRKGGPYLLGIAGLYLGIYLVGFISASGIFVSLFLIVAGKVRWPIAVLVGAACATSILVLAMFMDLRWPTGVLAP